MTEPEPEPIYRDSGDDRQQLRDLMPDWFRDLMGELGERLHGKDDDD